LYWTGDLGLKRHDGCVVHLGRRDNQVQIRGYRVEMAEIEIRLREIDGVDDAAVAAVERDGAETALVGYVVPGEVRPSATTLQDALRAKLPAYMVPTRWVFLQALPRAPNGKLQRIALPLPAAPQATDVDAYVAPSTAMERLIAGFWKKVLSGVDRIGLQDRFIDLGGDSLGAMRVIILIESDTGVQIDQMAFWNQTLGELAAYCVAAQAPRGGAASASGSRTIPSVRREPVKDAPRRKGQDGRPG
jgi:acyl carrier protein